MTAGGAPRFGLTLAILRRASGLTQEQLAERAGLSTRAISDLERGLHRAPRRVTLDLLTGALGCDEHEAAELAGLAVRHRKRKSKRRTQSFWGRIIKTVMNCPLKEAACPCLSAPKGRDAWNVRRHDNRPAPTPKG